VVVPENCEESVRAGCYQRWSQDPARMAQCVRDGYKGCGVSGLGSVGGAVGIAKLAAVGAAVGLAGAALFGKSARAGAGIGAAVGGVYAYGSSKLWFPWNRA
jgi:hypothetical protein